VCCSVSQHVAVCCSVVQCGAVWCSVLLRCVAVCCSALQCVAGYCSLLQCVAVCCSVLQCSAACCRLCCRVLQSVAVLHGCTAKLSWLLRSCCSVLQCVAVCCSVLHCVAVCCIVTCCEIIFFPPAASTASKNRFLRTLWFLKGPLATKFVFFWPCKTTLQLILDHFFCLKAAPAGRSCRDQ